MNQSVMVELELAGETEIDPIEEIRPRTWARKHYAPAQERDESWHPVVLDEMSKKDHEGDGF